LVPDDTTTILLVEEEEEEEEKLIMVGANGLFDVSKKLQVPKE